MPRHAVASSEFYWPFFLAVAVGGEGLVTVARKGTPLHHIAKEIKDFHDVAQSKMHLGPKACAWQ